MIEPVPVAVYVMGSVPAEVRLVSGDDIVISYGSSSHVPPAPLFAVTSILMPATSR